MNLDDPDLTVADFYGVVDRMLTERCTIGAHARYLGDPSREDKDLREELLPLSALFRYLNLNDDAPLKLGGKRERWDAQTCGQTFEVTFALPRDEHEIRRQLPHGTEPAVMWQHADDHLQFPQAIIDRIADKNSKAYGDQRTLLVVFDGDYSLEDDELISRWIATIQDTSTLDPTHISSAYICELARRKIFPLTLRYTS